MERPSHDQAEVLGFAEKALGPASRKVLEQPTAQALILHRMRFGAALEDAVLGHVHGVAGQDREVADEFVAFFLREMRRRGKVPRGSSLRRFLDTEDLVNSVLCDLWPSLLELRFESRAQFLALLGQRLEWKSLNHRAAMHGPMRSENRRVAQAPEELPVTSSDRTPSSLAASREEREQLILTLMQLPDRDRRILRLFLLGRSTQQIATELGVGLAAARKALQRAIARARALG